MKGKLYLIPVTLGGKDYEAVIPGKVLEITRNLRFFIVEEIRSSRRYLRLIDPSFPLNETWFGVLNEHTERNDISHLLQPAIEGNDIGLMSEAGLPCIADPGALLVAEAHRKKIQVIPLSGPSSIIMALISSGFNGQSFTFNGYLPVDHIERTNKLKDLEKKAREGYSQIFMETPYRNGKLLESILSVCQSDTELCIAADITLPGGSVITKKISGWKTEKPELNKRLVVFVMQASGKSKISYNRIKS